MNQEFHNPTVIKWCDWLELTELLPPPPLAVLIMTGSSSKDRVETLCERLADHDTTVICDIPTDPTDESVRQTVIDLAKTAPDWVIAVGGGSVLDTAKAAALLARNPGDILGYLRGEQQPENPGIPLIAVPTTAGSGSEVTPFASITDLERRQKVSLTHEHVYPRYAVIDPSLTVSVPPQQTCISGMDTLSHAIEGYWSKRGTAVTGALGLQAARLALDSMEDAYTNGQDLDTRHCMCQASLLGGLTISNARTTAVHAASYPLSVFFGVPHGLACSMLLPSFIRYNAGCMQGDSEERLLDTVGVASMGELADNIEGMKERMDMPNRLGELGLTGKDVEMVVDNGFRPDRVINNPREVTRENLTDMLEAIL